MLIETPANKTKPAAVCRRVETVLFSGGAQDFLLLTVATFIERLRANQFINKFFADFGFS